MTLPILLGEAPSKRGDRYHDFPLSGPPARVLCTLAGIPPVPDGTTYGRWTWALYDRFECRNLFERYADATPWSAPRARERAAELLPVVEGRVVVLLGRRTQTAVYGALGGDDAPPFHRFDVVRPPAAPAGTYLVAMPHPSGLNRALNDESERVRCGETLRAALRIA